MRLQNKVAIITGADSGIGKAIALQMAREGAAVTIDYIGPPDDATQVVDMGHDVIGRYNRRRPLLVEDSFGKCGVEKFAQRFDPVSRRFCSDLALA